MDEDSPSLRRPHTKPNLPSVSSLNHRTSEPSTNHSTSPPPIHGQPPTPPQPSAAPSINLTSSHLPPTNPSSLPSALELEPNRPKQSMVTEIKELTARLTMLKTMYQINKMEIKFRVPESQVPFFHRVELESQSVEDVCPLSPLPSSPSLLCISPLMLIIQQLRGAIAKRLQVAPYQMSALVRDGDTLVTMDEDLSNGMQLDVYF